ncbi:uncharacterized protein FIESC28_02088 [Fusarium coffeatum]|uniref:Heterokaryon incompatibility domain-containing protein n=1 Tax=Fusarium coffeatum TaxID=231269 RepID=A0A366S901_9HYPO|nr:uncharacterized protein FIESC28_02088 [Fusarium coffeatum]RBR25180.1 hypothetical protein FIESC28_02088 [Fusarium coffeatum]
MTDKTELDSSLLDLPLPQLTRATIANEYWAYQHQDQHLNSRDLDLQSFWTYYNKECTRALHNGGRYVALRSHRDVVDCIRKLKSGMLRHDIKEELRKKLTSPHDNEDEMLDNSIDLAASLLLMMSFSSFAYGFSGRSHLRWSHGSLESFVSAYFDPGAPQAKENVKMEKIFTARNLCRIAGLDIVWTDNLVDHLRLIDDDQRVHIFHHASFLYAQQQSTDSLLPKGLADETLQTLALLFPSSDEQTRHWYTFWVAVLVLVLTIFFGLVQSIEGALQVYASFKDMKDDETPSIVLKPLHKIAMGSGPSTLSSSSLCNTCRGLCENGAGWCWTPDARGEEYPVFYLHHRSLSTLFSKARAGCGLCSLFCTGFELDECEARAVDDRCETESEKRRILSDTRRQETNLIQLLANPQDYVNPAAAEYYEQSDLESLRLMFGRSRLIIKWQPQRPSSKSDALPAFLSVSWLGSPGTAIENPNTLPIRVLVKHRNNEAKELPKRVIEINSNEPQSVKLVHTNPGDRAIYACLSYCWGHGGQYCTYKHNIKDHLQHISVSDLPAAVADAIRLCRALQIPYLWVDALCIIQDDEVDWSREAAAMARIYGSANLTISTPSTTSCSEGFLVRDVGSRSSLDWIHPHSRTKGVVTMRSWSEPTFDRSPIDERETPWMQRGWTLQEWVLSPRLLHCGSTMTMFECLHGRCYEIFPDTPEGPFVVFGRQHHNGAPPPKLIDHQVEPGRISSETAVEANGMIRMFKSLEYWNDPKARPVISWAAIVEEFCRRQLTRDTDKLSALAGLAAEFRAYKRIWCPTQQQWDYFAGLWWCGNSMVGLTGHDGELPGALLWRGATHLSNPLSTPPVYRAPSWSWAAVDGPITFNKGVGDNKLEILDVVCHHEYPGSFSSVTTGWIDAHGLMRRVWPVGRTLKDKPKGLRCQPEGKGEAQDGKMWYADFDNAHIDKLREFEIFLLLVETCNDLPDWKLQKLRLL